MRPCGYIDSKALFWSKWRGRERPIVREDGVILRMRRTREERALPQNKSATKNNKPNKNRKIQIEKETFPNNLHQKNKESNENKKMGKNRRYPRGETLNHSQTVPSITYHAESMNIHRSLLLYLIRAVQASRSISAPNILIFLHKTRQAPVTPGRKHNRLTST